MKGANKNEGKDFILEGRYLRDQTTLEKFINKYIEKGNYVITEGWSGYSFIDRRESGYHHIQHLHGRGDFDYGFETISHIEGL